jgi:TonB family protein
VIALGMLAALLVAALAGAAAAAAERSLRLWGRQARWAWAAALAASLLLPVGGALLSRAAPRASRDGAPIPGMHILPAVTVRAQGTAVGAAFEALRRAAARVARHDRALALAWGALSLVTLVRLARGARALGRARQRWAPAELDATPVLVARDAGPLVVGLRRPRVVLPEWALALEPARRAMILRHEVEHVRAHDPALLAGAAVAVALAPWNPAAWWQLRRLRLAVELDCDARVLRAHPDVARYGMLLLDVARRVAPPGGGPLLAAALVEPTTDLERRIATMRNKPPRHRALLSAALALASGAATLGAFAACRVSEATPTGTAALRTPVRATDTVTVAKTAPVVATASDARPATVPSRLTAEAPPPAPAPARKAAAAGEFKEYREFRITRQAVPAEGNLGPRYPQELREAKVEGEVIAQFVVDTAGRAEMRSFKVLKSDHGLFTDAVRESLAAMQFIPAEVEGRKVKQLLQMPFHFQLTK